MELDDETSPSGSNSFGYATREETEGSPIRDAIEAYLVFTHRKSERYSDNYAVECRVGRGTSGHPLLLHTHDCWVGYSEYTIEDRWSEVSFTWGEFSGHFDSMSEFFKALSDAELWREQVSL